MEEKKIQNKNVLFLFLIIIILIGGFLIYNNFNNKEEQKIVVEKSPIKITNNDDGTKTVRNVDEDVEIKINNEWTVPDRYLSDEKILVENLGENNKEDLGLQDGSYMKLYVFENENNFSIEDWAKNEWNYNNNDINIVNINGKDVLKTYSKVSFGLVDLQQKEDSGVIDFSFVNNNKIYSYTCVAAGLDYESYLNKCEELIKQNIK